MEASRSQLVSGRVRSGLVGNRGSAGGQGVEHVGVGHDVPARAAAPRLEAAREGSKVILVLFDSFALFGCKQHVC